jgi:hypothetical protein
MASQVFLDKQDLTYLKWAHIRNSSGTAGTFLKSESVLGGIKKYYKMSNFDMTKGTIGHECVNELIVDRLLNILGVDHIHYDLINADVEIEGRVYSTFLSCSEDFKIKGDSKTALDGFYMVNTEKGESHYDFCKRYGWQAYVDRMIAVDYIILNRDRHGANIEILRNSRAHTLKPAPLFDHGLSLLFSCASDEEATNFDILEDRKCQNFIGGFSCYENLSLIKDKTRIFKNELKESDKEIIFKDLDRVLSKIFIDKMWDMIYTRYRIFTNDQESL